MEDIGKYKIVRLLGEGGMGRVYEAVDPVIGRRVAIKRLSADIAGDAESRARFFREAQAAGQLSHPNLITIHDIGEADGHPYIVMEFLEGADLSRSIRGERLPLETKLRIMAELCEGLAFAHGHDVIHRDIKPANIFITTSGRVKILDFGLARGSVSTVTRTGKVLGTPHYMAPEQIRGDDLDHRADIFSAGVVFYELLSGRKAFDGESVATTIYKVLQTQPEPLYRIDSTLPPQLSAIVERAMAKDRTERFQTTSELLEAVRTRSMGVDSDRTRSFATAATVAVPPELRKAAAASAASQPARRVNWMWAVAAVIVLAAIGGIADLTFLRRPAPTETPVAPVVAEPPALAGSERTRPTSEMTQPTGPVPAVVPPPAAQTAALAAPAPTVSTRETPRAPAVVNAAPVAQTDAGSERTRPTSDVATPSVAPPAQAVAPPIVPTPAAPPEPRPAPVDIPPPAAVLPPPPVASAPAAPREPPPSAEAVATAAIEDLVSRYQAALEARDLTGLKRIWPGLTGRQEDAIRTEFQNARAINATIDGVNVRVNGNNATAVSRRNYQVTMTDGRTLRTATRMTMTLTRRDAGWVIDGISHEAIR